MVINYDSYNQMGKFEIINKQKGLYKKKMFEFNNTLVKVYKFQIYFRLHLFLRSLIFLVLLRYLLVYVDKQKPGRLKL